MGREGLSQLPSEEAEEPHESYTESFRQQRPSGHVNCVFQRDRQAASRQMWGCGQGNEKKRHWRYMELSEERHRGEPVWGSKIVYGHRHLQGVSGK